MTRNFPHRTSFDPERLRVLFVLHMPWDPNLGAPRLQIELAEQFRQMGHKVEKFAYHDAFPGKTPAGVRRYLQADFSSRAISFVRAHAHRFDIIEAHQGNLPIAKRLLGFNGLSVARSAGLYAFYNEFESYAHRRWGTSLSWRSAAHSAVGWMARKRRARLARRSFVAADLINVHNQDEVRFIRDSLGLGDKCRVFPYGMTQERLGALGEMPRSHAARLQDQEVVFIGAWGPRKGSKDWGQIVRRVRQKRPGARFRFVGTGVSAEVVWRDLEQPPTDWIRIVPSFTTEALPDLLSTGTVGAFPSYIEGFGISILEKLAAGLPTVAYDVPGPRSILGSLRQPMMTPVGDVELFAEKLNSILELSLADYKRLSDESRRQAEAFRGEEIAQATLAAYRQKLAALGTETGD